MSIEPVKKIDDLVEVRNVIISVSEKKRLDLLVPGLIEANPDVTIYSTGGTHGAIAEILGKDAGRNLISVAEYIKQPETKGGLVKTLDFMLFLGYLTETYCEEHQRDLARTGAVPIDMAVFNLYPYEKTVAKFKAGEINPQTKKPYTLEDVRGNIDVGGPSALRAAGKNWLRLLTVVDPADYSAVVEELRANNGRTRVTTRFELHKKVFGLLAGYNAAIEKFESSVDVGEALKPYEIMNRGGK